MFSKQQQRGWYEYTLKLTKMFSHCFPDYDSCQISDFLDAERYLVILRKEEKLA